MQKWSNENLDYSVLRVRWKWLSDLHWLCRRNGRFRQPNSI